MNEDIEGHYISTLQFYIKEVLPLKKIKGRMFNHSTFKSSGTPMCGENAGSLMCAGTLMYGENLVADHEEEEQKTEDRDHEW